jgi:hypothetical protein
MDDGARGDVAPKAASSAPASENVAFDERPLGATAPPFPGSGGSSGRPIWKRVAWFRARLPTLTLPPLGSG